MVSGGGDDRMEEDNGDKDIDYVAELEAVMRSDDTTPRHPVAQASAGAGESGAEASQSGNLEAVVLRLFRDTLMPQITVLVQGGNTPVTQVSTGGAGANLTLGDTPLSTSTATRGPAAYSTVIGRRMGGELTMAVEILEPFDSEDEDANVNRWLSTVDRLGEIHGWTAVKRSYFTQAKLRGAARAWFNRLEDFDRSWEGWKEALRRAFPRKKDFAAKMWELMNRRKANTESMSRYYHA